MPEPTNPRKRALMPSSPLRRALRAAGHHLAPVVQVGKEGVTPAVAQQLDEALRAHELVKVKVGTESPEDRFETAARLGVDAGAQVAQILGRTILVYRRHPENPRFEPRSPRERGVGQLVARTKVARIPVARSALGRKPAGRKTFGSKPGERKPFGKRAFEGKGERKPFGKRPLEGKGERKPFRKRPLEGKRGERKPFGKRPLEGKRGERKPFGKKPGERKPFARGRR